MTGLHRARSAVLGAACVAATLAAPAPAAAEPGRLNWSPVSCATGAVTGFGVRLDPRAGTILDLTGWIQPCQPSELTNGFAVIVYRSMGAGVGGLIQPYAEPPGPTEFDLEIALVGSGDTVGNELRAACLAYGPYDRVACVSLDEGDRTGAPAVAPLPADDPLVRLATVDMGSGLIARDPVCGTCL